MSHFFSRNPEDFDRPQREASEADHPKAKPRLLNPKVLWAPPKNLVAVEVLRQLALILLGGYLAVSLAILVGLRFFLQRTSPPLEPAYSFGLGYGLFLGLSWAFGAILSANSSSAVKLLATIALSPVRFLLVLLGIIVFAKQFPKPQLIKHHVLFLMAFQVLNHGVQIYVNAFLDRHRTAAPGREQPSKIQAQTSEEQPVSEDPGCSRPIFKKSEA